MMYRRTNAKCLLVFFLIAVLAGCGGGGGSSNSGGDPAPVREPESPAPETPEPENPVPQDPVGEVITPEAAISEMGVGINLGNTLDAPDEGEWALPAQESFFQAYENAGFTNVRIPVTWGAHTSETAPYTVDQAWMDRVEQVVDWALARDLYVILNAHHESWLKEDTTAADQERFKAIWTQVSERFQDKSARLLFEILNEPEPMPLAMVNELNAEVLDIIREKNPTRLVVFSGDGFTSADRLAAADVPNDDYLIGNFHSYDPWAFAGQCTRRWGSQADKEQLASVYQTAKDWSDSTGVPVMVNEFGVAHYDFTAPDNVCNEDDRLDYLRTHAKLILENGFAGSVWDDGGSFVIYDRVNGTWGDEKDALVSPGQ